MKTTFVWKNASSVLVGRESKEAPSDEEWDGFLAALASLRRRGTELRVIVVTDGGGPSSAQRGRLKDAIQGASIRAAVVSDSMKVRFTASAVMLIAKNIGSFTTKEMSRAYDHLSLTPEERSAVGDTLRFLESELKSSPASLQA